MIQAETARTSPGHLHPDMYMFDLSDSLFTRGYMISYYFSAWDNDGDRSTLPRFAETQAERCYPNCSMPYRALSFPSTGQAKHGRPSTPHFPEAEGGASVVPDSLLPEPVAIGGGGGAPVPGGLPPALGMKISSLPVISPLGGRSLSSAMVSDSAPYRFATESTVSPLSTLCHTPRTFNGATDRDPHPDIRVRNRIDMRVRAIMRVTVSWR